jgi:hypothetical protein
MSSIKNRALWNAASELTELVQRLGGALTPELREEHKFAIEVASAIEKGYLNGNGTPAVMRMLGAAYTDLSVADWERCEELRKANDALKARQAADRAAAEAAASDPLMQTLDDVLADRPALYKVGDQLLVRYEKWDTPRAAEVSARTWRNEASLPAAWVYTLQTQGGTYTYAETDTDWDVDFHPHN